jgi:hypothetical protein
VRGALRIPVLFFIAENSASLAAGPKFYDLTEFSFAQKQGRKDPSSALRRINLSLRFVPRV